MKRFTRGIYVITNKANGKVYVGGSSDVGERLKIHCRQLKRDKHYNKELQKDFSDFGIESFEFEMAQETDKWGTLEQYWINFFEANNPEKGYNKAIAHVLPDNKKYQR